MRHLIYILVLLAVSLPGELKADDALFESFIDSREVIATIYFPANTAALHRSEHDQISRVMATLRKLQANGHLIRVEGYSSPEGSGEGNMHLSMFRARTIAEIIAAKGCEAEITLTGYGDLRAKLDDYDKERRVEIAVYDQPSVLKKLRLAEEIELPLPLPLPVPYRSPIAKEIELPLPAPKMAKSFSDKPVIDALTIEQAIMEKIGAVSAPSSGSFSQLDPDYVNR